MRRLFLNALPALAWLVGGWPAAAQTPVPLGDPVEVPLLPPEISAREVELSGQLLYLWKESDGTHVIHYVGDFEMRVGDRRVSGGEAVVWMTPRQFNSRNYREFEIFLWRNARVVEPAGTLTEGPIYYVTLSSSGEVQTRADQIAMQSSSDTTLYQEAVRVRTLLRAGVDTPIPEAREYERKPSDESPQEAVRFRADEVSGGRTLTAMGNVVVVRGDSSGNDTLELYADAAVIFRAETVEPEPESDEMAPPAGLTEDWERAVGSGLGQESEGIDGLALGPSDIEAVYLEGDILLMRGERSIRADRLYYDLANDRALILDAVMRTEVPGREVPLYIRADEIRQLSRTQFAAEKARITTSEFHTPHYHIGAERIEVQDSTPTVVAEGAPSFRSGAFSIKDATFNVGGTPVLYWPYSQGNFEQVDTTLKSARTGYSDRFGYEVETRWNLFNLLAVPPPKGFDGTLRLDYLTDRGPAVGLDLDYETDSYFGLYRGYYINDHGQDNLPNYLDNDPDSDHRGRSTWCHRQYLADDWQLTLENSYITDRGFLEEYFEREFDVGKDQETVFYLKKQRDNWAFTTLANWRIPDFYTQTEHLPDFAFRLIGQPLGDSVTAYSENRAGFVRFRSAEQTIFEKLKFGWNTPASDTTARADTRQELEVPLELGPIKVVPFGSARGSAWESSPENGGLSRVFGAYGLRGSMYLSRVFPEVESELFDIHGLRHIIKPDVTAWVGHSNLDSSELYLFDENVEDIDEVDGVTVGVRQRWQTKRGAPDKLRTVDVLTLDIEAGAFNDNPGTEYTNGFASYSRPENSITQNYVNGSAIWRINDSTALLSEVNYDMNDGEIDVLNVSYAVERDPRFSYLLGYRYIGEVESNLLGFGANYKLNEKHTIAFREEFDLDRGQTHEFTIGLIRRLPRWYLSLNLDVDEVDDDFGVSMSVWPEGLPNAALGSRRFTGLADSIGIRPE